jgi:hypothetical protein
MRSLAIAHGHHCHTGRELAARLAEIAFHHAGLAHAR